MLLWAAPAPAQPQGEVLDRVAAVVEGQVITLSELDLEARVQLIQRGGTTAATGPLDEETLRSALELSIAERVEALEADKLQAFQLDPEEVASAVGAFERRFSGPAAFQVFLAEHEADRAQLAAILIRSIRAERLLDSKIQLRAQVADWEVRRYYDSHPDLSQTPFEQLRSSLHDKLMRERYAQLARAELSQMTRAAQVRRVAPFARATQETTP
jgi:hypothetical protein